MRTKRMASGVPAQSSTAAPAAMAILILVQAIIFKVPFKNGRVEVWRVAPLTATAEMVLARPSGTASRELAAMVPASMAVVEEMPCRAK